MRTVIFILALSVHAVAVALGGAELQQDTSNILVTIMLVCTFMDVVDFLGGKK